MARESVYEKIQRSFKQEGVEFTDDEAKTRDRLYFILELKMKEIYLSDYRIFKRVKKEFTVTYPQITRDITFVERIIACEKFPGMDPQKAWTRYFISEVNKDAIRIAKEQNDGHAMSYAANIVGKHQQTDKEDNEKPPFDQIVPFNPIPTSDPTVLGLKPIPNIEQLREKFRKKFGIEKDRYLQTMTVNVEDADIIEEEEP
jgi:hypothetical protein